MAEEVCYVGIVEDDGITFIYEIADPLAIEPGLYVVEIVEDETGEVVKRMALVERGKEADDE